MVHNIAISIVALLIGSVAFWYAVTLRRLLQHMRDPKLESMSEKQRAAYMQSADYLKVRQAVRAPIFATTVLLGVLILLTHLHF